MTGFLGAVTEQLHDCAELMGERAGRLQQLADRCQAQIEAVTWTGTDAESFRDAARQQLTVQVPSAVQMIRSRAQALQQHAREQEEASSVGTAGSGDSVRPGLPRTGDGVDDSASPTTKGGPVRPLTHGHELGVSPSTEGGPARPYTHGHEGHQPDPLEATAAARDERDLMQEYLPVGMHPGASTQWSSSRNAFVSIQDRLFGYEPGEGFKNEKAGVTHTTTYTTKFSDKGVLMPDGSVVFASTSTITRADTESVSVSVDGNGGGGSIGTSSTMTTSQEITVPPGVELPPNFNPHDPATYPEGVRVRFDSGGSVGASGSGSASVDYRGLKFGVDILGSTAEGQGTSVIVENLGDGRTGVTQGPTAAFDESRGFAMNMSALDLVKVSAAFTEGEHSSGAEYQSAVFDRGVGDAAMNEFMDSGELPAAGPGVSDRATIQVMNHWHTTAGDVKRSVGGETIGEDGAPDGRVDAGNSWNMWSSTSELRSAITVEYHEDGSTRSMVMYADDPSTGMYAVEDGISLDGAWSRENYLHVPVTGPAVEEAVKDMYGVALDGDDAIQIHYTPEQMRELAEMQRGSVGHAGMKEGFGDSPLPEVLADNFVHSPEQLLDHLAQLEMRRTGGTSMEEVGLVPGEIVRDPGVVAEAAGPR